MEIFKHPHGRLRVRVCVRERDCHDRVELSKGARGRMTRRSGVLWSKIETLSSSSGDWQPYDTLPYPTLPYLTLLYPDVPKVGSFCYG